MEYRQDHIHLRTADPVATAQFYIDMFGAQPAGQVMNGDALRVMVNLGGFLMFIEQVPPETLAPPPAPFRGIEHIGLLVSNMDQAVAELRAKGAKFVVEPRSPRPGVKIAFIEGPDGVRVEILEKS